MKKQDNSRWVHTTCVKYISGIEFRNEDCTSISLENFDFKRNNLIFMRFKIKIEYYYHK